MKLHGRRLFSSATAMVGCWQSGEGLVTGKLGCCWSPNHHLYWQSSRVFDRKHHGGQWCSNDLQRIQSIAPAENYAGKKLKLLSSSPTNLVVDNLSSLLKDLPPELTTLHDLAPDMISFHGGQNQRESSHVMSSSSSNRGNDNRGQILNDGQQGRCRSRAATAVEDHASVIALQKPDGRRGRRKSVRDIDRGETLAVDLNDTPDIETKDIDEQILTVLKRKGITQFTPIQAQTYDHVLAGRDMIAKSRTGTGKTIAFGLPIIQRMCQDGERQEKQPLQMKRGRGPRFLVICPTRELAQQVSRELGDLGQPHNIAVDVFYGGSSYVTQEAAMRRGLDVLVATPGRLLDHLSRGKLDISRVAHSVLDEADEMLNMGFADDIESIFRYVHLPTCQVLLFSATIPPWVSRISAKYLKSPLNVDAVGTESSRLSTTVKHVAIETSEAHCSNVLEDIIAVYGKGTSAIVFVQTKRECDELASGGAFKSLTVQVLHGDIGQKQRDVTINQFRQGKFQVLIATDVAARGIDISNIGLVLQYHLPNSADMYVHRSGRTGRAGRPGTAVSLYSSREEQRLVRIEKEVGKNFRFQRASVPTYSAVVRVAGLVAMKNLQAVDDNVVPHFRRTAKELLDVTRGDLHDGQIIRENIEVLLSKCLAAISRKTTLQVRSMLTGEADMTTLVMSAERLLTQGDAIYAVKTLANAAGVKCKVGKVVLANHGMAAVFDVPKEIADDLINFSRGQNLKEISFSIPDELPELQIQPTSSSSSSLPRFNRRGGGGSNARYCSGYGEQSRYRRGKEGQSYSDGGDGRHKRRKYERGERRNSRYRSGGLTRERNIPW